jgi:rod shape-determining protein MreC
MIVQRPRVGVLVSDRLFLVLLGIALVCYGLVRFFRVEVFSIPAAVVLAPRSLVGGVLRTGVELRRENQRLSDLGARQELELGYWRSRALAQSDESLGSRYRLTRAAVIGRDPQSLVRTLIVDKGLLHGVRPNQTAITDAGLVGKVIEAGANLAYVGTLLNPKVKAAVLDQRSRVNGVAVIRSGNELSMDYVMPEMDVAAGDTIVTSGIGGVFPTGVRVGVVRCVDSTARGMFRSITVRPAVEIARVEDLYLVEPVEWDRIDARWREAREELRRSQARELRRLVEESRFEREAGGTARSVE